MKKKAAVIMLAMALSAATAGTALAAGWQQDEKGYWYQYDDGSYATGTKEIDGKTYLFDAGGYMMTGWQYLGWKWYYFNGDGSKAMGWTQLDGKWYYLDPADDGAMYTWWLELPDPVKKNKTNRYYLDENGVMATGIFYLSDSTSGSSYAYQADENGVLICNKVVKQGDMEMRYDSDGRIRYRNAQTKADAKEYGTEEWQYLLSENEIARIREEQMGDSDEYRDEYNDEYYDEYYDEDYDYGLNY